MEGLRAGRQVRAGRPSRRMPVRSSHPCGLKPLQTFPHFTPVRPLLIFVSCVQTHEEEPSKDVAHGDSVPALCVSAFFLKQILLSCMKRGWGEGGSNQKAQSS